MSDIEYLDKEVRRLGFVVTLMANPECRPISSVVNYLKLHEDEFEVLNNVMETFNQRLENNDVVTLHEYVDTVNKLLDRNGKQDVEAITIGFLESGLWTDVGRWFIREYKKDIHALHS